MLPVLLLALGLLTLGGCQSGQSEGGIPGLFGGAGPKPVAPGAATQTNTPPAAPGTALPRPAISSDAIETEPLPGAPNLIPPGETEVIRIGFLAPLSGPSAGLGRALFDAAQMALFDLGDDRILLLPRDTEGNPDKAAAAAGQVIAEGAQIIIGPLFSAETVAVGRAAQLRGIKVLSFSTDRSVAGNGIYLLGFTPDQQVARIVSFIRSRGMNRLALLAPDSPYGIAVTQAAQTASAEAGVDLVQQDRYPSDIADLTPTVRRFAAALRRLPPRDATTAAVSAAAATDPAAPQPIPVDAILLPEGGARLRALAPLLPYFDIDPRTVKFLGTGLWDDPGLGAEPALQGGWFAGPAPAGFADFAKRFEQNFGRRPPRLASLAYDATALAGILAKQGGAAAYSDAVLSNPDGFAGYDGIFRFRIDGVVERGLAVLEVQRHGSRVIDPAPTTFRPPTN